MLSLDRKKKIFSKVNYPHLSEKRYRSSYNEIKTRDIY